MLISSVTSVCRELNYSHIFKAIDDLSTAVPLVMPDSWSNLTQLRSFRYDIGFPIAGPLPSSWSKLGNLSEIYANGEYCPMFACKKSKLPYQLS